MYRKGDRVYHEVLKVEATVLASGYHDGWWIVDVDDDGRQVQWSEASMVPLTLNAV
jgi:hypothetical protein